MWSKVLEPCTTWSRAVKYRCIMVRLKNGTRIVQLPLYRLWQYEGSIFGLPLLLCKIAHIFMSWLFRKYLWFILHLVQASKVWLQQLQVMVRLLRMIRFKENSIYTKCVPLPCRCCGVLERWLARRVFTSKSHWHLLLINVCTEVASRLRSLTFFSGPIMSILETTRYGSKGRKILQGVWIQTGVLQRKMVCNNLG